MDGDGEIPTSRAIAPDARAKDSAHTRPDTMPSKQQALDVDAQDAPSTSSGVRRSASFDLGGESIGVGVTHNVSDHPEAPEIVGDVEPTDEVDRGTVSNELPDQSTTGGEEVLSKEQQTDSQPLDGGHSSGEINEDVVVPPLEPTGLKSTSSSDALGQAVPEVSSQPAQGMLEDQSHAIEEQNPWMTASRDPEDDPFRFLGENTRSNSFPDVAPGQSTGDEGQISTEPNKDRMGDLNMFQADNVAGKHISTSDGDNGLLDAFNIVEGEGQMEEASYFDRDVGAQADGPMPTDAEARYEEGLPLIHSENGSQEPSQPVNTAWEQQRSSADQLPSIDESPGTELIGVYPHKQAQSVDAAPVFQHPQRKSTEQVLGSLDMSSQQEASLDLDLSKLSIRDHEAEAHDPVPVSGANDAGQDVDLTAMWQAALGDDELLDDENEATDTATWFPEDAQGQANGNAWDVSGANNQQDSTGSFPFDATQSSMDAWKTSNATVHMSPPMTANNFGQGSSVAPSWQQPQAGVEGIGQAHHDSLNSGRHGSLSYRQTPQTYSPLWNVQPGSQRPEPVKSQSFVDKSKGGYASPYDLPADLTRPRKRGSVQHVAPGRYGPSPAAPPLRSSSVAASQPPQYPSQPNGQLPGPRPGLTASATTAGYPLASHAQLGRHATMPTPATVKSSTNIRTFFEEIPVTAGAKRSHHTGRASPRTSGEYPPQGQPTMHQHMGQSQSRPQESLTSPAQESPYGSPALVTADQLRQPDRMDPFATTSRPSSSARPAPASVSRYSPAPPSQPTTQGRAKYAPAPGETPPPVMPHQPRTSSPLATKSTSLRDQSAIAQGPPGHPRYTSQPQPATVATERGPIPHHPANHGLPQGPAQQRHHRSNSQDFYGQPPNGSPQKAVMAGVNRGSTPGVADEVNTLSNGPPALKPLPHAYPSPPAQYDTLPGAVVSPPRRSQTQSPGTAMNGPQRALIQQVSLPRPASVDVPTSPRLAQARPATATVISHARPAGPTPQRDYIAPTDGREHDPLSRWRGCPIFSWGFGGTIVTSFPKEVPRYSPGQRYPSLKCSPGEVRTRAVKEILPLEEHVGSFPGPLRGKVKKKDVIGWLLSRIAQLDAEIRGYVHLLAPDQVKRHEERILLLKVLCVLVENDGSGSGSPKAEQAMRELLISHQPGLMDNVQSNQGLTAPSKSFTESKSPLLSSSHPLDPAAVDTIKKLLLGGEKEKAVWHAVDNRMWAHAMLISSAVAPAIWKQVVREFVRQGVRQNSRHSESLAAVYQIFAGNIEEFIDELVPSSARAGLKLISTTAENTPSSNGLEGLDKWIETLTLVLSNRSAEDGWALKQLGQLLLFYDRVEAAHICFLFAGPCAPFGGVDDSQSAMALLGQNHLQGLYHGSLIDSTLLSEVYEFGLSLANPSAVNAAPHLQAFKYYHALILAQHGHLQEAQLYCESIGQAVKSAAKAPNPYYRALAPAFEDLSKRLQRSAKGESSSWISKPSIEKVSDSLFARFNNFVAGNENNQGKPGAGSEDAGGDVGPFSRIAGNTPVISRPSSQNDMHPRSLPQENLLSSLHKAPSGISNLQARYTPVSSYVPQPAQGPDQNMSARATTWDDNSASYPAPHLALPPQSSGILGMTQPNRLTSSEPSLQYKPLEAGTPSMLQSQEGNSSFDPNGYLSGGYPMGSTTEEPSGISSLDNSLEQSSSLQGGYPPISYGYQPPSYEPLSGNDHGYEPPSSTFDDTADQNGAASHEEKPKKKSFMDDDDDELMTRAAELSRKEKQRKDKEAEENFRKAAEADAKRGQQGDKKGWFGGWFGKKEQSQGPGPIRAKLGEESSFYYDPELKKWVNKKGGTPQASSAGTPPPPKGPPSRAVSGPMGAAGGAPPRANTASAPPLASASTASPPPPPPPLSSSSLSQINTSAPPSSNSYMPPAASGTPPPAQPPSRSGTPTQGPSPSGPSIAAQQSNPASGPSVPAAAASSSSAPNVPETSRPPVGPSLGSQSQGPPPPRPATAMSHASSIDDLLGPASAGTARKGGTMKKAKRGRGYVDVMAGAAGAGGGGGGGGSGGVGGGGLPT